MRARFAAEQEERSYRVFVTESLRLAGERKYMAVSWLDMIKPEKQDSRTAEEIAADVIRNAGLIMQGGE